MALLECLSGWVSTLLGTYLADPDPWQVTATRDVRGFLRALPLLAPPGAIAYFEGTGARHIAEYLRKVSVEPQVRVAAWTIWPRPDRYHVPVTVQSMDALAAFLDEDTPTERLCNHCHLYVGQSMLLEWHNAFSTDPMCISRKIGKETVTRFAATVGSSVVPRDC